MKVTVTVQLDEWDEWTLSSDETADAVLQAFGGDESKDTVTSFIQHPQGTAGAVPSPPPPE